MLQLSDEELRALALQLKQGLKIKDRRYHFRTYRKCFVGNAAVSWLLEKGPAAHVVEALQIGNAMMQLGLFHHVLYEHTFRNEYLYYRFTEDDELALADYVAPELLRAMPSSGLQDDLVTGGSGGGDGGGSHGGGRVSQDAGGAPAAGAAPGAAGINHIHGGSMMRMPADMADRSKQVFAGHLQVLQHKASKMQADFAAQKQISNILVDEASALRNQIQDLRSRLEGVQAAHRATRQRLSFVRAQALLALALVLLLAISLLLLLLTALCGGALALVLLPLLLPGGSLERLLELLSGGLWRQAVASMGSMAAAVAPGAWAAVAAVFAAVAVGMCALAVTLARTLVVQLRTASVQQQQPEANGAPSRIGLVGALRAAAAQLLQLLNSTLDGQATPEHSDEADATSTAAEEADAAAATARVSELRGLMAARASGEGAAVMRSATALPQDQHPAVAGHPGSSSSSSNAAASSADPSSRSLLKTVTSDSLQSASEAASGGFLSVRARASEGSADRRSPAAQGANAATAAAATGSAEASPQKKRQQQQQALQQPQPLPDAADFRASPEAPVLLTYNMAAVPEHTAVVCHPFTALPFNNWQAIPVETDLFSGVVLVFVRNLASSPEQQLFEGKKRLSWVAMQGRFKQPFAIEDVVTGQEFARPFKRLPAMWFVEKVLLVMARQISPSMRVGPLSSPQMLMPLLSAAQIVNVSEPGSEPQPMDAVEDVRLAFPTLCARGGGSPAASDARRRHFSARRNLAGLCYDTRRVWTFHLWQNFVDLASYRLDFGYSYDLVRHLDCQPLQVMAKDVRSGRYLYNLSVWNERLLPVAPAGGAAAPKPAAAQAAAGQPQDQAALCQKLAHAAVQRAATTIAPASSAPPARPSGGGSAGAATAGRASSLPAALPAAGPAPDGKAGARAPEDLLGSCSDLDSETYAAEFEDEEDDGDNDV